MNQLVLADITPLLPGVLKKVPWYVRALLLAAGALAALYVIAAHCWNLPLSHDALLWISVLELPFNLPAFANVNVGRNTAISDAEKIAHAVAAEVAKISFPTPVVHIYHDVKDKIEPEAKAVEVVAPVVAPVVEAAAAPAVSEADALFAKRSAAAKKAAATRKANAAAKKAIAAATVPVVKP